MNQAVIDSTFNSMNDSSLISVLMQQLDKYEFDWYTITEFENITELIKIYEQIVKK